MGHINTLSLVREISGLHKLFSLSLITLALSACGGGGSSSGGNTPSPQPQNQAPVLADIAPMLVSAGNSVTLSSTATDPEGDSISYAWVQVDGNPVSNAQGFDSNQASFSAPDEVDTIKFRVTASAQGGSDTKDVLVIIVEDTNTAVFVDASYTGTSDGSLMAPYTDLNNAIHSANSDADFYVQTPQNDGSFILWPSETGNKTLNSGQSIYGSYDANWDPDKANNKTPITINNQHGLIYGSESNLTTTISGLDIELIANDIANLVYTPIAISMSGNGGELIVENNNLDVKYEIEPTTESSVRSVFGIVTRDVETVRIFGNTITTGHALSAASASGRTLGIGENGNDGEDGRVGDNETGGAGGSGLSGAWNGGTGGNAGIRRSQDGFDGTPGNGRTEAPLVQGGFGGSGGLAGDTPNGGNGGNGDDGVRGRGGEGGNGSGATTFDTFFGSSQGQMGSKGFSGAGGGGGGGGAASSGGSNGGAGGGGGEGGEGGEGGFGASQGGFSIGVNITGGSLNEIKDNTITSGNGGTGGVGGVGARGGFGGQGGVGDPGNLSGGEGGDGGNGGSGGFGGAGGSGGGGASYAIFLGADTPATIENNNLTSGNGGNGGNARYSDDALSGGDGGWSFGIFDSNPNDNFAVFVSDNQFTIGQGGADGAPKTGTGETGDTNL
ncbi:hypothetical protein [Glaciecola sp. SC05]|uniref:PKD domain-containing protein n=1 Tax=Glaciecola sp. SC05 TaxID=1987355 RepID=UPI0035298751